LAAAVLATGPVQANPTPPPPPPPAAPAPTPPAPPPVVPAGLKVTGGTFNGGTVDWDDLAGAAAYTVQLAQSAGMEGAKDIPAGQSTASVFGLAADRDYFVRVRGVDAAGQPVGDWSPVITARTLPAPAAPAEPPVTVASFNIRCANCYTGQNQEEPWTVRRDAVAGQIVSRRPDVIGLQEASQAKLKGTDIPQFIDLRDRLRAAGAPYELTNTNPYNCQDTSTPKGCVPTDQGASQGTRIAFNTETVELVGQGSKVLPSCNGCNRRYLAWAILKQKATGKPFFVGNVHTQWKARYAALRHEELRVMMDEIQARNPDKLPVFVVGDFNSTRYQVPTNAPYDEVIARGFADPLGHTAQSPVVSAQGTAETRIRANYNSHNNFLRTVAKFADWENGSNLDYILTTPMRILVWETVIDVDPLDKIIGTIPSDHNMILVKAALP
jgi:endonuclease/exonuclease/phosphatase family metal-dependent hydrolase